MIKKINDFLAGWLMTLVGGVFLLASLVHNAGSCFVVLLAALLYDRKYKFEPAVK